MKKITPDILLHALETGEHEIVLDAETEQGARAHCSACWSFRNDFNGEQACMIPLPTMS
jgi:hypothetical protein